MVYLFGVLGALFLYLEFFLPGGILAFFSGVCFIFGIYFACLHFEQIVLWVYIALLCTCSTIIVRVALWQIRRSKGSLYLTQDEAKHTLPSLPDLKGKMGVVTTELRPSGHVEIEGVLYQAVSQGQFIAKDIVIEVVGVKHSHVIVRICK